MQRPPHLCDLTLCLTLKGQQARQERVLSELCVAGIEDVEFFYGVGPDDPAVHDAFASGRVMHYPPCFRCGKETCDNSNCNNILLPVQVAVGISFQRIFAHCIQRGVETAAVCEDDVVLAAYARRLFAAPSYRDALESSGLFADRPALVRLGGPTCPDGFFLPETFQDSFQGTVSMSSEARVSNYFFLFNRAFAELAVARMERIDHTADVIIHSLLSDQARCLTLAPQLACDRSWALRTEPSLIHPKPEYLIHLRETQGEDSEAFKREAARLQRHRKVAKLFDHGFAGMPGCDFRPLIEACKERGLDIGLEVPGDVGVASSHVALEPDPSRLSDWCLDVPYFVHVRQRYWLVPDPMACIDWLSRAITRGGAEFDGPNAWLRDMLADQQTKPGGLGSGIDLAVRLFISWYGAARKVQPGPMIYHQDLSGSLHHALVKPRAPGPILHENDLQGLTHCIDSRLMRALSDELQALGFQLES